jgi:hypothetical protein
VHVSLKERKSNQVSLKTQFYFVSIELFMLLGCCDMWLESASQDNRYGHLGRTVKSRGIDWIGFDDALLHPHRPLL